MFIAGKIISIRQDNLIHLWPSLSKKIVLSTKRYIVILAMHILPSICWDCRSMSGIYA